MLQCTIHPHTSLFNLTHLNHLDLSNNRLNGTLPSWLFTSLSLQYLYLNSNMFSGNVPFESFALPSLTWLYLSNNQLGGQIDVQTFGQLTNLTHLDLSFNNFSGEWELDTLSPSLTNLEYLDLSYSGFSVTTNNANHSLNPRFRYLRLASCKLKVLDYGSETIVGFDLGFVDLNFGGTVAVVFPDSLRAMKQLWYLDLSSNEIYGQIPHWAREIGSTYELEYVNLSHNFITSLLQFQLYGLEELYLQSNLIQESFPPSICNMSNLMYLDMSNNRFGGLIPQCFGNITSSLEMIDMGNNSFQGMIPSLYDGCENLAFVLKSNNFHGHIQPSSTVEYSFQSLRVLDLSDNRFVGQLPAKYFQNFNSMKNVVKNSTTPEYLNLGAKYYSFVVAVKWVNQDFPKILVDYTIIDLSNNRFEGHIPNVIGGLNSLIALNLSRNSLIGSIPHALGNLIEIESLDHNRLVGRIPEGTQFNTFDEKSFEGNVGLCRFPLPKMCSEYIHKPHPEPRKDHDEESGFTWEVVTLGYGCGTLLGLFQEVFGEAGILDSGKAFFRHWLWSAILVKKLKQRRALSNSNKGVTALEASN
ncbi:leucine-rich repeat-containing protein, partial [Tanacetum coccineum]